ncbi:MAG: hypothetical protein KA004_11305 [Verrucomicrobiales bacterium]|nr:hypothetical protein [Verrucomicrobiales bacterium]
MRHPWLFALLVGLLAGLVGDSLRWVAPTGAWAAALPWMSATAWNPAEWVLHLSAAVFGVAGAWIGYAVSGTLRAASLMAAGTALCFSGSAAVALHKIGFDPFPSSIALMLGGLVGWAVGRSRLSLAAQLPVIFSGRISAEQMQKLRQSRPLPDLQCENRPVVVITLRILNEQEVRKLIGPAAVLKLAEEFRQRAVSGLLARGALLLPGATQAIQACFGVPLEGKNDVREGCQAALLLLGMMREFVGQRNPNGGGRLRFGIGVCQGLAASGLVNGEYQTEGDVLERSRHLADANDAWLTGVLTDAKTLSLAGVGFLSRPIDSMIVGTEEEVMDLMELCPAVEMDELPAQRERMERFAQGVGLLRSGNAAAALEQFQQCEPRDGTEDVTLALFLEAAAAGLPDPATPVPQPATAKAATGKVPVTALLEAALAPPPTTPAPAPAPSPVPPAAEVEQTATPSERPVAAPLPPQNPDNQPTEAGNAEATTAAVSAPDEATPPPPEEAAAPPVQAEPQPLSSLPAFVTRALNSPRPPVGKAPILRETFSKSVVPRKSFGRGRRVGDMFESVAAREESAPADAAAAQPDLFAALDSGGSPAAQPDGPSPDPAKGGAARVVKAKQPPESAGKRKKQHRRKKK